MRFPSPRRRGASVATAAEVQLVQSAARRHGVFTYEQAIAGGVSPATLHRRVVSGEWIRIHRGVYAHASAAPSFRQRLMAGVLACGGKAIVSHRPAAVLWELLDETDVIELTIPHGSAFVIPGIVVRRSLHIEAARRHGFPVSRPMRTLLELGSVLREDLVERALDSAHRRGLIDLRRFSEYLDAPWNQSAPSSGELRRMVAIRDPDTPIDSDLETLFFAKLRRVGLPIPQPQYPIRTRNGWRYIDFAFPSRRIGIELDGFKGHGDPEAFERDRARQNDIVGMGFHFQRFTWRQVKSRETGFLLPLADLLGLEPTRWKATRRKQPFNTRQRMRRGRMA
jgi:Transcriptional regulator, AbiEi antitoxin